MRKAKEKNPMTAVVAGVILCVIVTSVLAVIMCFQMLNGRIGEDAISMFVPVINGVAAGLGIIFSGKIAGRQTMIVAAITGLVYWLSLALTGMLVLEGSFNGLVSGTIAIATGMLCAILVLSFPARRKGNRKKLSR